MILNYIDPDENETYRRKRGWTENICVRRPYRRQGLARALLARSLKMHRDLGMAETALGVDAENAQRRAAAVPVDGLPDRPGVHYLPEADGIKRHRRGLAYVCTPARGKKTP